MPLHKESESCFHEEWLWHSCRVPETTKGCKKAGWNFQSGFQGLEVTLSSVPRAVLQAQTHTAPQEWMQVRESYGN